MTPTIPVREVSIEDFAMHQLENVAELWQSFDKEETSIGWMIK